MNKKDNKICKCGCYEAGRESVLKDIERLWDENTIAFNMKSVRALLSKKQ